VTARRRLVSVPATSANLGPGFDVFAAALSLHLELEVWEAQEFGIDTGEDELPRDRSNLCVRAFEELHSADGVHFEMTSQIPLARGLGSSAAAIVAGLMAADHMYELALSRTTSRPRSTAGSRSARGRSTASFRPPFAWSHQRAWRRSS
jgi:homoserine kinase